MKKKKTLVDTIKIEKNIDIKEQEGNFLTEEEGSYDEYKAYLHSIKEICDLALKNGDLRSALSAKKLEADWIKQNKAEKGKFGLNSMSDEELEEMIKELEDGFQKL